MLRQSTSALREAIRRLPKQNAARLLPGAVEEWGLANEESASKQHASKQGWRHSVSRGRRRRTTLINPFLEAKAGTDNVHDRYGQLFGDVNARASDFFDTEDEAQRFFAAVAAAAVQQYAETGNIDAAVALADVVHTDDAHDFVPAVSRAVTDAAVNALVRQVRVMSALKLLASEIEAGRPVSTASLVSVAQGFVKWAPRMDPTFCRVALAEHILDCVHQSGNAPTVAVHNAVLALAAQAKNRKRFFGLAIGDGGDGGIVADMFVEDEPDANTIRILLRAVRERRELEDVLVAVGIEDFDDDAQLNPSVPPVELIHFGNIEVGLEYVRALLRCGLQTDAVQVLYHLHRHDMACPTAWNAVLGRLSRQAKRGADDMWLPANNVFRKM